MHFTCFDLVLEGVLAVHQQLVQVERLLGDGEVDHLLELLGVVEVEYLGGPVVLDGDVVQQDLHHLHQSEVSRRGHVTRSPPITAHLAQELPRLGVRLLRVAGLAHRPQLCRKIFLCFIKKYLVFYFIQNPFFVPFKNICFHAYRNIMQMAIMMRLGSGV